MNRKIFFGIRQAVPQGMPIGPRILPGIQRSGTVTETVGACSLVELEQPAQKNTFTWRCQLESFKLEPEARNLLVHIGCKVEQFVLDHAKQAASQRVGPAQPVLISREDVLAAIKKNPEFNLELVADHLRPVDDLNSAA